MVQARAGSGAKLPGWVRDGFARAATARAEPKLYAGERAKIRAAGADRGRRLADVWGGEGKDPEYLAASLMDYLAFGPEAAKLLALLKAFTPGEDGNPPAAPAALEAAKIDAKALEVAWKKWAAGGK
jgi:hypothetical protein